MKTRAVILAGGEGSRLGVLTAKRTKPAVPVAGKYRIIDFTLSNCVNSGLFDVMILAQYRPHSLIEHIGVGGPWDLNRDFSGGVRLLTPYKARGPSDWYLGTADAVQQNFMFIKRGPPDNVLILSGDHIYQMNYKLLMDFHAQNQADLTIATIRIEEGEASRFGILGVDKNLRIESFIEKPEVPPSNLANMGVYLFNTEVLDHALWDDHERAGSTHDFGRDILPRLIESGKRVFAYPYEGYWMDVGTVESYWQAHMDLLRIPPPINLNDRSWIVHTRTEERPPARISRGAVIADSLIADGCVISSGAHIEHSVLSPGVRVREGAIVRESVILTDCHLHPGSEIQRGILDKRVQVESKARVGSIPEEGTSLIAMVGKNSIVPSGIRVEAGATVGPDVVPSDYKAEAVSGGDTLETQRQPYET